MLLTGFLSFEAELDCLGEVLGQTLPVVIGGVNAVMAFPRLSEKSFKNSENNYEFFHPLDAPQGAEKWKQDDIPLFWGNPISFPDISASIAKIAFFIECTDNEKKTVVHDLYNDMPRWKDAFLNYCSLSNNIYPLRDLNARIKKCDFGLYSNDYIQRENPDVINIYWIEPSDRISLVQVKKASEFASLGKEFLLEYQMVLSAYDAIERSQNRPAILDACSALELCLIKEIDNYCSNNNLNSSLFLSKFKSLGDRVKLVQTFFPAFSHISEIEKKVVSVRNNMAHNRTIFPTDKETDDLLNKVEECLQFFYNDFYEL